MRFVGFFGFDWMSTDFGFLDTEIIVVIYVDVLSKLIVSSC